MKSAKISTAEGTASRQMYVFLTVALATFLSGILAIGFLCHGYVKPTAAPAADLVVNENDPDQPDPQAEEIAAAQKAAEEKAAAQQKLIERRAAEQKVAEQKAEQVYAAARQASAAALNEYETAQSKFLDFLGSHFGELNADIPTANSLSDSIAKQTVQLKEAEIERKKAAAKPKPVVVIKPKPKEVLAANPEWAELRTQLEELQKQRKKLLEKLTPSHPSVVAVDFDIADVEHKLQTVPAQISKGPEQLPIPGQAVETIAAAPAVEAQAEQKETTPPPAPAIVPLPTTDLAAWAGRWKTDDVRFHELTEQLSAAQEKYRQAIQLENSARDRKAEVAAAAAVVHPAPAVIPPTVVVRSVANPRRAMLWCGLAAILIGIVVAGQARITEPVFHAAAAVRQKLELPILGLLSRQPTQLPHDRPSREPRWIRHLVLAAELWLVALVILLAVTSLGDQQFWHDLIANPLAACSRKFFC